MWSPLRAPGERLQWHPLIYSRHHDSPSPAIASDFSRRPRTRRCARSTAPQADGPALCYCGSQCYRRHSATSHSLETWASNVEFPAESTAGCPAHHRCASCAREHGGGPSSVLSSTRAACSPGRCRPRRQAGVVVMCSASFPSKGSNQNTLLPNQMAACGFVAGAVRLDTRLQWADTPAVEPDRDDALRRGEDIKGGRISLHFNLVPSSNCGRICHL